jgi:hypothetical protein
MTSEALHRERVAKLLATMREGNEALFAALTRTVQEFVGDENAEGFPLEEASLSEALKFYESLSAKN